MPTLPASGYPTPQAPSIEALPVAPGGVQDIRATPEAFGFESARALTNLGTAFEKVATNLASIQDQYDTVVAREARNRALTFSQKLLYGDPDVANDSGFFGTEGRTALDRRTDTIKALEEVYTKERANLPTAQAQRLFDEGSSASRLHNQALVLHHASQQFQKYKAKEAESEVGLKLNEVSSASTRGDLDAMKQHLGEAINVATQALRERGASEAEIKAKASDLTATAVEYWSLGRAPTDPVGALAALEENKDHFTDPARYARLHGQIKSHADKEAGRKLVESTTGPGPGITGNAAEHYNHLISIGATPNEAALLTSAAQVESNFNPEATHDAEALAAKGLPPGYGLYGHNSARLAAMQKRFGPRPTWQQQNQFALDELRGRPEGAAVNAAKTPEELTELQNQFEQPKRTPEGNAKRLATTRQYMTAPPQAPEGNTSSPWAPTTGPDGKTYMLTGPQAEQYKSITKPEDQQKFLAEAVKTPVAPGAAAPSATAPTTTALPESPLAGQVARIQASGASPEVKEAAIAELHRQHAVTTMGQDEAKYELTKAIVREDPSITPEYVDTLVKSNRISPAAGTEALNLLGKVQDERKARAEAIVRVEAAGAGGAPLDPKSTTDKKALDYHYEVKSASWPREEALPRSIAYAAHYGMVPERLRAFIRGGLHSARPDLAVLAANTITTLRNSNPELVAEIGDEADMRLANLINTYASAGMPPDKAVELATESLKVTPAIREARAADYDLQRGKEPKDRTASDEKWIASQQNSLWVREPAIDPMMRTEFAETAKAEFQRTGNLEASRRMALDTVNRVWGRSEVGGERRYVKQAPEKFYSIPTLTPAENSKWMNEQLLSDVSKGALQDPANPITSDRLRLIPDPTRTNGGNPVYQVWLVQPNKGWEQVIDTKGAPILWHPDYSTSADRKRRDDAAAAEIERARTLRKEQGEREQMVPDPRRYRNGP